MPHHHYSSTATCKHLSDWLPGFVCLFFSSWEYRHFETLLLYLCKLAWHEVGLILYIYIYMIYEFEFKTISCNNTIIFFLCNVCKCQCTNVFAYLCFSVRSPSLSVERTWSLKVSVFTSQTLNPNMEAGNMIAQHGLGMVSELRHLGAAAVG